MEVIYCDNHLLVVNKPAGMSTQTPGLEDHAKQWLQEKFKKPGKVFLEPIHRLDKVVSGLVLFARTSKALSRLQAAMREQQIGKTYRAEIEGVPEKKVATLEHYIAHGDYKAFLSQKGKKAILHYQVVASRAGKSILEVILETGRYHQIRLQLATIGHPILGDEKYGSTFPYQGQGIGLKHIRLHFDHPVTKEKMIFEIKD